MYLKLAPVAKNLLHRTTHWQKKSGGHVTRDCVYVFLKFKEGFRADGRTELNCGLRTVANQLRDADARDQ